MQPTSPAPFLLAPPQRPGLCDGAQTWRVTFSRVPCGVVAGRMQRFGATGHTDRWALFHSREQFATCATHDPLRFAEPLLFVQMTKEFDHAYDQQPGLDPECR